MKKENNNKHWLVAVCCCGFVIASVGICINATGVFFTPMAEKLGVLRGTVALNSTFFSLASAIVTLLVPRLMKKLNYKLLCLFGVVVASLSTIAMGYVNHVALFNILGIIRGFGSAIFSIVPITMIINGWFIKKHGLVTSVVLSFTGLAGAICSPLFTSWINQYGLKMTYLLVGILLFVFCIPGLMYPFSLDPKDEGLLAYGATLDKKNDVKEMILNHQDFNLLSVSFVSLCMVTVMITSITGITQHLPSYAESIGFSASVGALLVSSGMIGNIVSKLVIGYLSDLFGVIKAFLVIAIINIVSIIVLLNASSYYILVIGSCLFGSVYGLGGVGFALLTRHLFGNENYYKAYPTLSFFNSLFGAFSISLIGYIYDFLGSYDVAFIIALGFYLVSAGLLFICLKQRKQDRVQNRMEK